MNDTGIQAYIKDFKSLDQRGYPSWLVRHRSDALEVFRSHGFPGAQQEEWKYTDISPIAKRGFSIPSVRDYGLDTDALATARLLSMPQHELVFCNGHALSTPAPAAIPAGCLIGSLAAALQTRADLVQHYYASVSDMEKNAFVALNSAFANNGAVIYVADGSELELPVHLVFVATASDVATVTHPRNLIILGKNAKATIVESYVGADSSTYFTNAVTEVIQGAGSSLEHYRIQQESPSAYHIGTTACDLRQDCALETHTFSLGGSLTRNDFEATLSGRGADVVMDGLFVTKRRQHVDNHLLINHVVPETSSNANYRGVLDDRSRGVFSGKVIVHQDAQKTDAHQSNSNLLLSKTAEIDSKPELEIYADDVKCSHGATVGRIDENMLFYLRSRALAESTAKALLVFAFADELIRRIHLAAVRQRLEDNVSTRLLDTEIIREFMQ